MAQAADRTSLLVLNYTSVLRPNLPTLQVVGLILNCWHHNRANGVTGFMAYADGRIRQQIEGPVEVLAALSCRILCDARHSGVEIRRFGPTALRMYDAWTISGFDELGVAAAADGKDARPWPEALRQANDARRVLTFPSARAAPPRHH